MIALSLIPIFAVAQSYPSPTYNTVNLNGATGYLQHSKLAVGIDNANNTVAGWGGLPLGGGAGNSVAIGQGALPLDTAGEFDTAVGQTTMRYYVGTGGNFGNVALGHGAMAGDDAAGVTMAASGNAALGTWAIQEIQTGNFNTCVGTVACAEVATGSENASVGYGSNMGCNLCTNNIAGITAASFNASLGAFSLLMNKENGQVAVGFSALKQNTTGTGSTAVGYQSQSASTVDLQNTSVGYNSMLVLNGGSYNASLGAFTLGSATTGSYNTVIGSLSGQKITTGFANTILGEGVAATNLTTGYDNILIGAAHAVDTAAGSTSDTINIGNVFLSTGINVPSNSISAVSGIFNAVGGYESNGTPGISVACTISVGTLLTFVSGIITANSGCS